MARNKIKNTKIHESFGDRVFNYITAAILIAVIIIVGYPCLFVISCSFSSSTAIQAGKVVLLPVDFTLRGYEFILRFQQVWVGYRNSIFYTFLGTVLHLCMTILGAYPLSRRTYQGRAGFMKFFYFSTLFGAGLIPTFLLKTALHMNNTIWPTVLAGVLNVSHIIILRTCFSSSIPGDLFDAAKIDGASDFQCLFKIALPLAKATLSVITLYAIVGCWNEYFTSMIYLNSRPDLQPLQLILRPIMQAAAVSDGIASATGGGASTVAEDRGMDQVRYGLIIVATVPALLAYAIVQKYFKKGVMVGSVKG